MSFFEDEDAMRLVWSLAVYLNHDHQPMGNGRCAGCGVPSPCERQQAAQEDIDAVIGHADVPVHDPWNGQAEPVTGLLASPASVPARRLCRRWWRLRREAR